MEMTIQYDKMLLDAMQKNRAEFEAEAKMAMAVKLFEMGQISSGTAARLVGMGRSMFLLKLHEYRVPMIQLEEDELLSDIENA